MNGQSGEVSRRFRGCIAGRRRPRSPELEVLCARPVLPAAASWRPSCSSSPSLRGPTADDHLREPQLPLQLLPRRHRPQRHADASAVEHAVPPVGQLGLRQPRRVGRSRLCGGLPGRQEQHGAQCRHRRCGHRRHRDCGRHRGQQGPPRRRRAVVGRGRVPRVRRSGPHRRRRDHPARWQRRGHGRRGHVHRPLGQGPPEPRRVPLPRRRSGNGFMAVDERDGRHRVYFRRVGGGY